MSKSQRRYFLKERDLKKVLNEFSERFSTTMKEVLGPDSQIEILRISGEIFYLVDKRPVLIRIDEVLYPTLFFNELLQFFPAIIVDMGAISHICSGADVMSPGIVRVIGSFFADDFVLVKDERHNKNLAIGIALLDSEAIRRSNQGKMIKNVHYVGDRIWRIVKSLHFPKE